MIWYKNNDNIVISSRIRLARNLSDTAFPNALHDKKSVLEKIKNAITSASKTKKFKEYDLNSLSDTAKTALSEEHLISPQMVNSKDSLAFINEDKNISIMVMEEDHIRLQVIMGGYALDEAFKLANETDDALEEHLDFAFDEELGFLTACPTNTGTGLRASVMLHLPALAITDNIGKIAASAGKLGITVRGFYGEGSKSCGNFYQISNQITSGESEEDIIKRVKNIVEQIINLEKQARENLMKTNETGFSEKIYRSYGILKYTHSISSSEAKNYLSDVLLGQNMGIIKEIGILSPMECIVRTEPAMLSGSEDLTPHERDIKRAEIIRKNI